MEATQYGNFSVRWWTKITLFLFYIALSESPLFVDLYLFVYQLLELHTIANQESLPLYWYLAVNISRVGVGLLLFGGIKPKAKALHLSNSQFLLLVVFFLALANVIWYLNSSIGYTFDSSYRYQELNSYIPKFDTYEGKIDWLSVLRSLLLFCLLTPICEEIVFRYFLLSAANKIFPTTLSVMLASVPFALLHTMFLPAFVLGTLLGYLYLQFGLKTVIWIHVIHNTVALAVDVAYFQIEGNYLLPSLDSNPYFPGYTDLISFLLLVLMYKPVKELLRS